MIEVSYRLVVSKNHLAPMKKLSIPRLKLLGCVALLEPTASVKSLLRLDCAVHYWTDTKVPICWINGVSKDWLLWFENHVNVIQTNILIVSDAMSVETDIAILQY